MERIVYIILKSGLNILATLVREYTDMDIPMDRGGIIIAYEIKDPFTLQMGMQIPLCGYYKVPPPDTTYTIVDADILKVFENEVVDKAYKKILEDFEVTKRKLESGIVSGAANMPPGGFNPGHGRGPKGRG